MNAPVSPASISIVAGDADLKKKKKTPSKKSTRLAEEADCSDEWKRLKSEGNSEFKLGHYHVAIEKYSEAIDLKPTAVLHANRAFAYLKTESFGLATMDAEEAISLDPSYEKGYYRLGSAFVALSKWKDGLKVFRKVCKLVPKSREARKKLSECKKQVKREAFEAAIATERGQPLSDTIDVESIAVPGSYSGPHLAAGDSREGGAVTLDFVKHMIREFKAGRQPHKKYVVQILLQMKRMMQSLPSLIEIETGDDSFITVCGDTHGQFYDVLNIFEVNGPPSETNAYLFNGDYVDRGSWSVEVALTFFAYKLLYPKHFFLLRGNHETINMNRIYGFEGEVMHKYDATVNKLFTEVFQWLPLAGVINKKVMVVHGGLFQKDGVKLDDIRAIKRGREPPESGLMSDMLWSDPQPFPGRAPSKRGVGQSFGPDVTKAFLDSNGLELLIRSHEVRQEGYLVEHDGCLITVFSAPNYCDQMGNKGAFIKIGSDSKPNFQKFEAVPHPPIKPMAYAGSGMSAFGL